jgi:predicted PurR-regulated permease PerM
MDKQLTHKWVLLLLVFFISALFLSMIRPFLMSIFLAGIFSALSYPLYLRFEKWFKGKRYLASLAAILIIAVVIILPLAVLLGIVTNEAVKVATATKPWVERQIAQPDAAFDFLKDIPFIEKIEPYRKQILSKTGEMVVIVSNFLIEKLRAIAFGTVNFLLMTALMLYTMFFFFVDGKKLLAKILYYLPLEDRDERLMLDKFTSVARATLKGTLVIGILQGGLAGLAFAVVGIPSAVFWSAIMTVLSIIPGIGTALVWIPATIFLAATGHGIKAVGLAVFCAVVVGSLDNILRPILVGKDTQMHELMILFGTLGGIIMFGIVGFIIGPIIAALFVTIWEIYGTVFKDILPPVKGPLTKDEP